MIYPNNFKNEFSKLSNKEFSKIIFGSKKTSYWSCQVWAPQIFYLY